MSLFPQNNPSGFLAKALWVLPPHNPSCAAACNCHQKTAKVFSTDLQFLLDVPELRSTAYKGLTLQNRTAHMHHAILFSRDYVWHFSRVRHFDKKHMLFHNAHRENSFLLHWLKLPGKHFYYTEHSQVVPFSVK